MKTCFYQYRKGLYEALETLGYDVYQHVPAGADTPYIYIGNMSAAPLGDATVNSQEVTVEIHVVNEYFGDQSSHNTSDDMMDEVMELLITKGVTTAERTAAIDMDDFEMTPNQLVTLSHETIFDDVSKEIRLILTMVGIIDQKEDVS